MSALVEAWESLEDYDEERKAYTEDVKNHVNRMELEERIKKLTGEYEKHIDDISIRIVNDVITMLRGRRISPQAYNKIRKVLDACVNPALDESLKEGLLTVADAHFGSIHDKDFIDKDEMVV